MKQIRDWAGIIGLAIIVASGLVGSDRGLAEESSDKVSNYSSFTEFV
jgi:hypothetical protein